MNLQSLKCGFRSLTNRLGIFLAAVYICSAVAPALAQSSNTEVVGGVSVTLALDKTEVSVGEPVILSITMENASAMPLMEVATNFQFSEGNNLEVIVQPAGELPYRYTGPYPLGTYADVPMQLAKGRPLYMDTLLLYDEEQPNGYLFSQPGTYNISVNFQIRGRNSPAKVSASLPATPIRVTEADGAAREAYEMLNEPELAKMLHLASPTTDSLSVIETAGQRYPGTSLGALALKAAGRFYALNADKDNRTKGALMLQDYLANGVALSNADSTVIDIATAWHLNEQFDVARQWIFHLVRMYPNSNRIRPQDALVYYYFFEPAEFAAKVPWYLLKRPWVVPGVQPPTDLSARKVD